MDLYQLASSCAALRYTTFQCFAVLFLACALLFIVHRCSAQGLLCSMLIFSVVFFQFVMFSGCSPTVHDCIIVLLYIFIFCGIVWCCTCTNAAFVLSAHSRTRKDHLRILYILKTPLIGGQCAGFMRRIDSVEVQDVGPQLNWLWNIQCTYDIYCTEILHYQYQLYQGKFQHNGF